MNIRSAAIVIVAVACCCCGQRHSREQAPYKPIAEVERTYGPLVTAGNHPTVDQHGTGERVGLFQDASGTVWGLPLSVDGDALLACAPPALQNARMTDRFDAEWRVIGATNQPTGWRGGTGDLELLLRDIRGTIRWQSVQGADMPGQSACWPTGSPAPRIPLHYYRLVPTVEGGARQALSR
jgi:hypothetical protein